MSDFGSVWDAADSVEADQGLASLTAARIQVTPSWSFLAVAKDPQEFQHRFALVEDRIRESAQDHGVSFETLAKSLADDFRAIQAEAASSAPSKCQTCGGRHEPGEACSTANDDWEESDTDSSGPPPKCQTCGGRHMPGEAHSKTSARHTAAFYVTDGGEKVGGPYDSKSDAQDAISGGDVEGDDLKVSGNGDSEDQDDSDDSDDSDSDDSDSDSDKDSNPFAKKDDGSDDDPDDDSDQDDDSDDDEDDKKDNPFAKKKSSLQAEAWGNKDPKPKRTPAEDFAYWHPAQCGNGNPHSPHTEFSRAGTGPYHCPGVSTGYAAEDPFNTGTPQRYASLLAAAFPVIKATAFNTVVHQPGETVFVDHFMGHDEHDGRKGVWAQVIASPGQHPHADRADSHLLKPMAPGGTHFFHHFGSLQKAAYDNHPDGLNDGPTHSWACQGCGKQVDRWRGESHVECRHCGAQYNAAGQRLRDDWQGNSSNYDDDMGDMEGYERQHHHDASLNKTAYGDGPTRDYEPYYHGNHGFAPGVGSYNHLSEAEAQGHSWKPHAVYDSLGSAVRHLAGDSPQPAKHMDGYKYCDSCDHVYHEGAEGASVPHPSGKYTDDRCPNCGDTGTHDDAGSVLEESRDHDRDMYDQHGHPGEEDNYGDPYGRHDNLRQSSRKTALADGVDPLQWIVETVPSGEGQAELEVHHETSTRTAALIARFASVYDEFATA